MATLSVKAPQGDPQSYPHFCGCSLFGMMCAVVAERGTTYARAGSISKRPAWRLDWRSDSQTRVRRVRSRRDYPETVGILSVS